MRAEAGSCTDTAWLTTDLGQTWRRAVFSSPQGEDNARRSEPNPVSSPLHLLACCKPDIPRGNDLGAPGPHGSRDNFAPSRQAIPAHGTRRPLLMNPTFLSCAPAQSSPEDVCTWGLYRAQCQVQTPRHTWSGTCFPPANLRLVFFALRFPPTPKH